MNNKELIAELAQRTGYTQSVTQTLVRQILDEMALSFDEGRSVTIQGFGTFEVKKRLERIVINPATQQKMLVPPKLVLNFKPNASIKERLKSGGEDE
ncbi:MAG: HU family DNA-binding protein [Prevotella sp.]|nr:HU family DNA-binding protein [Prevotella sp.]MDD7460929.1 HU family DNA-binding protein [Prevotellaceae bacterium]MDY3366316.1 HU family DNA-binding protein [Prevotella sp.]MDY3852351.1 HU family DNA-binding protein [Prevotella sp.]